MVIRQKIKISDERINCLSDKYHSQNQRLKSTMLFSITKVMENNCLPSSFDLSYPLNGVYDLIKEVLSDLGIAPIQIRAIFRKKHYLYHVQLAL